MHAFKRCRRTPICRLRRSRPRHLPACLVVALGLGFGENALASTASVADCTDAALRSAVAAASTGDTIDLSGLACSTLTLSDGAVPIGVFDLTLQGPTDHILTIDADPVNRGRVFDHGGHGTVEIDNLTLANGCAPSGAGVLRRLRTYCRLRAADPFRSHRLSGRFRRWRLRGEQHSSALQLDQFQSCKHHGRRPACTDRKQRWRCTRLLEHDRRQPEQVLVVVASPPTTRAHRRTVP